MIKKTEINPDETPTSNETSSNRSLEKTPLNFRKIWIPAAVVVVLPLGLYFYHFHSNFSRQSADWSAFSDFIGGFVSIASLGVTIAISYLIQYLTDVKSEREAEQKKVELRIAKEEKKAEELERKLSESEREIRELNRQQVQVLLVFYLIVEEVYNNFNRWAEILDKYVKDYKKENKLNLPLMPKFTTQGLNFLLNRYDQMAVYLAYEKQIGGLEINDLYITLNFYYEVSEEISRIMQRMADNQYERKIKANERLMAVVFAAKELVRDKTQHKMLIDAYDIWLNKFEDRMKKQHLDNEEADLIEIKEKFIIGMDGIVSKFYTQSPYVARIRHEGQEFVNIVGQIHYNNKMNLEGFLAYAVELNKSYQSTVSIVARIKEHVDKEKLKESHEAKEYLI